MDQLTHSSFPQLESEGDSMDPTETAECTPTAGVALAHVMDHADCVMQGSGHAHQHELWKGSKSFGKHSCEAPEKETGQSDNGECFGPISVEEMTNQESKKAQVALSCSTEKRDGAIKGHTVFDGKPTREWLSEEDGTSPTASPEVQCQWQ